MVVTFLWREAIDFSDDVEHWILDMQQEILNACHVAVAREEK